MLMTDGQGLPISAFTTSAQDAEVNTIETLVDLQIAGTRPKRLLNDKAADADWLRDTLGLRGIKQIEKKLRDGEAMLNAGKDLAAVLQSLEVSESTYHRWRNQYGGTSSSAGRRSRT